MLAEARSVSLLSCEESTYMAVEVGRAKKTILTSKGSPVTLKKLSIKKPVRGKTKSLKPLATTDKLK